MSSGTLSSERSQPNFRVVILIVIVAVLLAAAAAIGLRFFLGRSEVSTGQYSLTINGRAVYVQADPNKVLVFTDQPDSGNGTGGEPQQPGVSPTNTPLPPPTNTPVPPTATLAANMHTFVSHTVAAGDTLYSLANRYNTTIELMARFGVSGSDLVVGNVIQIAIANSAYCTGYTTYIVRTGDTLYGISIKCGTTVDELKRINDFGDTYPLNATDVICVPLQPAPTPR